MRIGRLTMDDGLGLAVSARPRLLSPQVLENLATLLRNVDQDHLLGLVLMGSFSSEPMAWTRQAMQRTTGKGVGRHR